MYNRFAVGMITGVVIGAAAAMAFDPTNRKRMNRIKRCSSGLFRTMGNAIDNIIDFR